MNRYARHTSLPWFGADGQRILAKSGVLVIGCGGLGCISASYLARAGVGRLGIVDPDVVGLTDLHRQVLYIEDDVAMRRKKALAAAERLAEANGEIDIRAHAVEFNSRTAAGLIDGFDLVVDCTDSFGARMLINDVCLKFARPWVHGACIGTSGIVVPFPGGETACYRCILSHIPAATSAPTCEETGILGSVAGATGCIEATEAIRLLVDPKHVPQRIIYFEAVSHTYESLKVKRKLDCPACVGRNYEFLSGPQAS